MSIIKPLPQKLRAGLIKIAHGAIANIKYLRAIKILESHRKKFILDDNLLYQLGLLYDHQAALVQKINRQQANLYLEYARDTYTDIIKRNPKNFFALYGLARVYANQNNFKKAVIYAKRAYGEKNKLPQGQKGSLPVGGFYERAGNLKAAEKWYKKELEDLGGNEFGALMNLLIFYNRTKQSEKARSLAPRAEWLMQTEFKKDIYKNSPVLKSKTLKIWEQEVQTAKELKKKGA